MFYILIILFIFKYYSDKTLEHYKIKTKTTIILLLLLFAIYNISALEEYIKWFVRIIPLILIFKENRFYRNISELIFYYTFSTTLASAMGYIMINNGSYIYLSSYVWNEGEVYTRFSGLIGDSLVYSQILAIAISLNLIKIEKYKANKLVPIISIIILSLFGVLTYSKTFIILTIMIFVFYWFYKIYQNIKRRKSINFLFICLIFIIGFLILLKYIVDNSNSNIISSYITRFSSSDLLTGRLSVYNHFFELWRENPQVILLGLGFAQYIAPYQIESGMTVIYSHNIIIETISLFGVLITIVLVLMGLNALFKYLKNKADVIFLLPAIVLLASGMVLHGNLEFCYYFNVMLAMIMYRIGIEEKKGNSNEQEVSNINRIT